jgi:hypothetical protein
MNTNSIVEKLKDNALSFNQLQDLVGPRQTEECRWIVYDELTKFKRVSDLMNLGAAVILLQIESPRAPKVGHFILLLDHGSHYEHFDSYGLTMDQERKITEEHHLTNIFKTSTKPIIDNHNKLQTFREDINTCGRWVVARLLLKKMELDSFLKLINYFHVNHDDIVAIMTMLLQFKN